MYKIVFLDIEEDNMISLNSETKKNLESLLEISLEELDSMDLSEEISYISDKSGKIVFSKKRDSRKKGRGNPLLARRRFRTMKDVNKGLDKIK